MSSSAGQAGVSNETTDQNPASTPCVTIDDNDNMDDFSTDTTHYVTGWRLVAVIGALVMSIFLVWLPHLERRLAKQEQG